MKINNIEELGALIALSGVVEPDMLKTFDTAVEKLLNDKDTEKKATIFLSTTGGKVWIGDALAERIRLLSRLVDLKIIAMTYVASAGVRIFLALPREKRFITPGGVIIIHAQTNDEPPVSRQSFVESRRRLEESMLELEFSEKREQQWIRQMARELNMDYSHAKELWMKSHRFCAKEAVNLGFAADIVQY